MRERTTIGRMIVEDQRGAYAVLFGIMSVVVILFAGLAIDVSLVFNERRAAQNAADHAALSAAFADCTGSDAQAAADSSVARNGFVASNLSLVDLGGSEYEATVQTVTEASFARVVGIDTFNISTDARAECLTGGGQAYAMFARGHTCPAAGKEQIEMPGSDNEVHGAVHSNGNLYLGGSGNDFGSGTAETDPVTYVQYRDESAEKDKHDDDFFDAGYPKEDNPKPDPIEFNLSDYTAPAHAAGHYFTSDIYPSDITEDGVYYTTRDIYLNDSGFTANVTLIAEGEVSFSGSNQYLTPYVDGLLAFSGKRYTDSSDQCDKFVVKMEGSNNDWNGIIYAPDGLIEMAGSSNTALVGSLIGYGIKVNGSDLYIRANPDYFPGDPSVRLTG